MKPRPKVLFLYTEISTYFLACIKALHQSADIAIVRWPLNKEAPFQFEFHPDWQVLDRNNLDAKSLLDYSKAFNPDILVCSGWVDKAYNETAKFWFDKIPTVLSLDNHYTGSLRQLIGRLVSPFKLKNKFSHVWVPGEPQYIFARKLGYKPTQILRGFYSADVTHFDYLYQKTFTQKKKQFPKRFLYMGRYLDFKGIFEMWNAFIEASSHLEDKDWELWCLGTGDEWNNRIEHQKIKHFGFIQPDELQTILQDTGVFVLPSRKEPWGVVVHEMAVAGFPMICSDKIGAVTRFLEPDKNGILFKSGDKEALKSAFIQMMQTPEKKLIEMGEQSHKIGITHTPEIWKNTLLCLLS
jgi:glycosyltransferase involved in cell wall biosynthesis